MDLPRRINYACGRNVLDEWLNVDNLFSGAYPHGFGLTKIDQVYNCDLLRTHPFPKEYFSEGLCEDFIEHLTEPQFMLFIKQVWTTMETGGVITFSFPCWDKIWSVCCRAHELPGCFPNKHIDPFKRLALFYSEWEHLNFWTVKQFQEVLLLCGFREHPDINGEHFKLLKRNTDQAEINHIVTAEKI